MLAIMVVCTGNETLTLRKYSFCIGLGRRLETTFEASSTKMSEGSHMFLSMLLLPIESLKTGLLLYNEY